MKAMGGLFLRGVQRPIRSVAMKPRLVSVPMATAGPCWIGGRRIGIATAANTKNVARGAFRPPSVFPLTTADWLVANTGKRLINTTSATAKHVAHHASHAPPPPPTNQQLQRHFFVSLVPFLGFGFMDNSIMIHAGNAIDCTLGVLLGLSTLSAAAIGQIVANGMSVIFGGSVDQLARHAGLPSPGFSSLQRRLPVVRRIGLLGNLVGVVIGSTLGLLNLLIIDTNESSNLKIEALTEGQEFAFQVEASNSKRKDATLITVRGPNVDGLLASISAALTEDGCTIVEIHGKSPAENDTSQFEDVFVVRPMNRQQYGQIEDSHLDELARKLLEASRHPMATHNLKFEVEKLRNKITLLRQRVQRLEGELEDKQITLEFSDEGGDEVDETTKPVEENKAEPNTPSSSFNGTLAHLV